MEIKNKWSGIKRLDNRVHHLGFCLVCTHRQKSLKGLLCKLTNEFADFESKCPTFNVDRPILEKAKTDQEAYINDKYHLSGIDKHLFNNTLINKEDANNAVVRHKKKRRFWESDTNDLGMLLFSSGGALASLIYFFVNPEQGVILLVLLGTIIASFYYLYRFMFYEYKVKFRILDNGIQTAFQNIAWSEIIDYSILKIQSNSERNTGLPQYYLLIQTVSGRVKKIDLNELDEGPWSIVKRINQRYKKYTHLS